MTISIGNRISGRIVTGIINILALGSQLQCICGTFMATVAFIVGFVRAGVDYAMRSESRRGSSGQPPYPPRSA